MTTTRTPLWPPVSARWERGTCLFVASVALVTPGIVLGAIATQTVWDARHTPISSRWGWSLITGLACVYVAPRVAWAWPGQFLHGPHGSLVASIAAEMLLGPLVLQVLASVSSHLSSPAPSATTTDDLFDLSTTALPGSTTDGSSEAIRLGGDDAGRAVVIDLRGEASVLVAGLAGTGKSTTLIRLISESLRLGWCVVVLDLKGSGVMATSVGTLAAQHNVPLTIFDRSDPDTYGYDPCVGTPSEVANALVGAFDYTGVASVYQQVAMVAVTAIVAALHAAGQPVTLAAITASFDQASAGKLARAAQARGRTRRVDGAEPAVAPATPVVKDDTPADGIDHQARLQALRDAATHARVIQEGHVGIQKRLEALDQGAFGDLLRHRPALDWDEIMAQPSLTYLSLPTLASPADVELLGRVIVQHWKQLADRRLRLRRPDLIPCLLVIDEFAALNEPAQMTDLMLQGREAKLTVVASTQFLPESPALLHTLLGAGVVIAHRVSGTDAETLAAQFGTMPTVEVSNTIDYATGETTRGSYRRGQTYTISPGTLRELGVGRVALRVVRARPSRRHALIRITKEDIS